MSAETRGRQQHVVLIVDDQPDNLNLLHDALDDAGYTVLVATDGESALQRARLSLPDVVLLDAVMPGAGQIAQWCLTACGLRLAAGRA